MSGLTSVLWTLQKRVALIFNKKIALVWTQSHFTLFSQDIYFRSYNLIEFKYTCLSLESPSSLIFRSELRRSFAFTLTGSHDVQSTAFLSSFCSMKVAVTGWISNHIHPNREARVRGQLCIPEFSPTSCSLSLWSNCLPPGNAGSTPQCPSNYRFL